MGAGRDRAAGAEAHSMIFGGDSEGAVPVG